MVDKFYISRISDIDWNTIPGSQKYIKRESKVEHRKVWSENNDKLPRPNAIIGSRWYLNYIIN